MPSLKAISDLTLTEIGKNADRRTTDKMHSLYRMNCTYCDNYAASGSPDGVRRPSLLSYDYMQLQRWIEHAKIHYKSGKGNGKPQGAFAFTLTKSPTDDLTVEDMVHAVRKLMSQKVYASETVCVGIRR